MSTYTKIFRGDPPGTVLKCRRRRSDVTAIRYGGDGAAELGQLLDWITWIQGGVPASGHVVGDSVQIGDCVGVETSVLPGDYLVADPGEPRGWRRCSDIDYGSNFETVGPAWADLGWGRL